MNKKQGGFGAVEMVLIVVIVILIGALGWTFWSNSKSDDEVASEQSNAKTDVYADWKTYTFPDTGTKFRYPSNWSVDYSPPSKEDNRSTSSVLLTYDSKKVLADNVTDSLWPSIDIYDGDGSEPTITEDVIYTQKLPDSNYLVCSYSDRKEMPGGPTIQRLSIDLVDKNFDADASDDNSALISVGGKELIVSGGSVAYEDGSLPSDAAKKLCESPKTGDYTTQVIQWLKSVEI